MKRLLTSLLLLLVPFVAFAADEPVQEHASGATVLIFLVLFIGSMVAYGVYLWWRARGAKESGEK